MSRLKIKFNVFEKRLVMQIIEQDKELTGTANSPITYRASNGIIIQSSLRPGVYNNLNTISLRGSDTKEDLAITYGIFNSTEEATEFMLKVNDAINEFLNKVKYKVVDKLLEDSLNGIKLPDCSLMFSVINGGLVMQVIESNIKQANLISDNEDIIITISDKVDKVELPFNTDHSVQSLISLPGKSKSEILGYIKQIITKIYLNSQGLVESKAMSVDYQEYPEYIYSVE